MCSHGGSSRLSRSPSQRRKAAKESVVGKQMVDATMTLKLKLAPGGGAAIRIVPVN